MMKMQYLQMVLFPSLFLLDINFFLQSLLIFNHYHNQNKKDETTPAFQYFLDQIGKKIKLKGWNDFAGGLNTKEDTTGKYSLFATYASKYKIMYHVTTYLPDDKFDEQRIAKKKHTGNDLVVIVFCGDDSNIKFNPKIFTSQFNHVFIVVSIDRIEEGFTYYLVNVVTKPGVKPIPPFLPNPPISKRDLNLRNLCNQNVIFFKFLI
jgi:hypothetical protein